MSPRGISEQFIIASGNAEHSLDFLCENLIHYVDKVDNPANLPEVRPKEDFWSRLKAKVYENHWEAKTQSRNVKKEVDQVTCYWVCEKKT